jgi:ABC-type multidrug transport system fused ATPase/permease subunit
LAQYTQQVLATVPAESRVLLSAHDAFNYFGSAYGFEVTGIQGISTESEAGLQRIAELVDMLVDRDIRAVFVESSVSDRNIRALIEGAAARGHEVVIGGELFSDAMGAEGTYEGTYIGMIDHNATVIAPRSAATHRIVGWRVAELMTDQRIDRGSLPPRIGPGRPATPTATPRFRCAGLTVSYAEKPAVFSVDASFATGAMTAIIGPNGAGKSTMLKACLGIVPRLSGEVRRVRPTGRTARAHRIAYVPQRASVDWDFPATVLDVVKMGLYRPVGLFGRLTGARRPRARPASTASAWPISRTARSASCPAASSSACSSPGRWRRTPISTCWTSPSPAWTPPRNAPSSMSSSP